MACADMVYSMNRIQVRSRWNSEQYGRMPQGVRRPAREKEANVR
jgi:hypothetical protein